MGLPISYGSITLNDNSLKPNGSPESTVAKFAITTMTPSNAASIVTAMGNLKTALAALVIGQFAKDELIYQRDILSTEPASSPLAQRENKWLCRYHDNVNGKKYRVEFGTADLSILTSGEEFLALGAGVGAAFKTAFEAIVVSEYDPSHSVTLDTVQFVGRNS